MDVRLAVDRGSVMSVQFVLDAVSSAVLVLAPFNEFQGGVDSTRKHPGL